MTFEPTCGDLFASQSVSDICRSMARRVETPAFRRTDPDTSRLAAEEITASGKRSHQQAQCAAAVRQFPGHTSFELAMLTDLERYMLGRRLSECETAGTVKRGAPKYCDVTGRLAMTWWPA